MKQHRRIVNQPLKKQWYILYCLVLLIPMATMLFSYRTSYGLLADAVYDRQSTYLTYVRDIVDTEVRNIYSYMLSLSSDAQIRKAVDVKKPADEKQMLLFRDIAESLRNAGMNNALLSTYTLYFPESNYLIEDGYMTPEHVLDYKEYGGKLRGEEFKALVQQAESAVLNTGKDSVGNLVLYMRLPIYGSKKELYAIATLSNNELTRILNVGIPADGALVGMESLNGEVYVTNTNQQQASEADNNSRHFLAEMESGILPMKYFYTIPTHTIEKELVNYRYLLLAFALASLLIALVFIRFAVHYQYAPIKRLMDHFSLNEQECSNEYTSINEYLRQAKFRNDQHFMTDMLLGNLDDTSSFPYTQLLLLAPLDGKSVLYIDPEATNRLIPHAKIVHMYEQVVLVLQKGHITEEEIGQIIGRLKLNQRAYIVNVMHEGQSIHQAYLQAADKLTVLRFFLLPEQHVYSVNASGTDQALTIMNSGFEDSIRAAILARNEAQATALMQKALEDMQTKCQSGNLLRSSLYAISLLFIHLEATLHSKNPAIPEGVSGEVVRSYQYTSMASLRESCMQTISDMIAVLELQSTRKSSVLYDQIESFIQKNYHDPNLDIDMIADRIGFSSVYVRRVYKQNTGMSITDAILRLRIETAKKLLIIPSNKVNDVASQVGFYDVGTFIRSFKKLEGLTPGAYKNQSNICEEQGENDLDSVSE